MASLLHNNSAQTFKTRIDDVDENGVTVGVLDASNFTAAEYRIFSLDCTTVLVTATLAAGDIAVEADTDSEGNPINVFRSTLTEAKMLDTIVPQGQYIHQFEVTNSGGLKLPPVFQETVSILRACD